ncbi:hypothetical protein G7Z17_g1702 [Cylindrodendrum hubeiense]|uniref:Uncharacterized protein n=1 Tax=Cylindrodendrum hubeiense TaxID=595255 RepID=A0A9P5LL39_9HYPO|nr:hypothetical protein G7Z17_g1702 [Cylindrodendrum hubeiense]
MPKLEIGWQSHRQGTTLIESNYVASIEALHQSFFLPSPPGQDLLAQDAIQGDSHHPKALQHAVDQPDPHCWTLAARLEIPGPKPRPLISGIGPKLDALVIQLFTDYNRSHDNLSAELQFC